VERRYCDVCGGIVVPPAESGADIVAAGEDDALICDVCVRTRRVFPEGAITPADERAGIAGRFRCPHCDRRLKTRTIKVRTEVDCPRCKGKLVLLPDGRVDAGLPSWPRQPGADDDEGDDDDPGGGGATGGASGGAPATGGGTAPLAGADAAPARAEAPAAAATRRDLPSDLEELLATSEAFAARAESESTEMLALEGRSPRAETAVAAHRLVSSSEHPAAPSFAPHASGEHARLAAPTPAPAPGPAPAPAPAAKPTPAPMPSPSPKPGPATKPGPTTKPPTAPKPVVAQAPATAAAVIRPRAEAPSAPVHAQGAPWLRLGAAAALVVAGLTGATLLRGDEAAPGALKSIGERIARGFHSLEARLK